MFRQTACLWICVGLAVVLASCGGADIVTGKPEPGERLSAAEKRRIMVDHPFMMSGEYFLQRERPEPDYVVGDDTWVESRRIAMTEKRLRDVEKSGSVKTPCPAREDGMRVKAGALVGPGVEGGHARAVVEALAKQAAHRGVAWVPVGELELALGESAASAMEHPEEAARRLGSFPGLWALVEVIRVVVPEGGPGTASASYVVRQCYMGGTVARARVEREVDAADAADAADAIASALADAAVCDVAYQTSDLPWYCHAFSTGREKNSWNLTAGAASGLAEGDELRVMSAAEPVSTPGMGPMRWLPGKETGRVRITALFDDDLSRCELVSGKGPTAGDLLVK